MAASPITLEQAQELSAQLADSAIVLLPDSDGYDDSLKKWSIIGCQRSGVTVRPKNAQSIAKAVLFASHHKIDLAVKGGGHSTDTSSSTDGGILIDLSSMKEISVDESSKQIAVQGGALWEDVYQVTSQHGLAVVGATISCTGVGGLTLRGGYGYLTPQHGLVIDNLLEAQVATADGSILTASAQQNPDLFWAIRGAGQNVGVVTELVFQAYDQKHMWTDQEKDKDVLSWGQKIQMMCEDELRRSGRTPDKLVSNFLGYTAGDSVSAVDMFGTNASRLLGIKKRYDPQNLFNKLNPLDSGTK
ncbi:FAD binding domain protein [Aspergillus terreus]|uniref:FAD binding domain protein n=1 Tax=Aspergillus terreus TaxID=33178 RepID=A0A5M3Z015_ASPTE|nr:hypothetical protein ATETN484_0007003400 [Aspergillus terreus]GFF15839.1 FAD binding domain protein [Aspergillus terreus]